MVFKNVGYRLRRVHSNLAVVTKEDNLALQTKLDCDNGLEIAKGNPSIYDNGPDCICADHARKDLYLQFHRTFRSETDRLHRTRNSVI